MIATFHLPLLSLLDSWDELVLDWRLHDLERSMLVGGLLDKQAAEIEPHMLICGEIRMRLLVEVAPLLHSVHGSSERTRSWLRRPDPTLGGRAPLDVMAAYPEWIWWLIDGVERMR